MHRSVAISEKFFGVITAFVMFLIAVAGCGSEPAPNAVCAAGSSVGCNCSDGRSGAQVCNAAGSGYGVCECGSPMDGGVSDGGPVCAAGATQACSCAGGGTGTQACRADGSGYNACSCSPSTCTVALSGDGFTFTDTCSATEICVCPAGALACTDGHCGAIDGRTFSFVLGGYLAPMLDAAGNCYDDIFTPCNDPPDLLVTAGIGTVGYGPIRATDTPTLSGGFWSGTFGGSGFMAAVGIGRGYAFTWEDEDTDANDAIGDESGTLTNEMLRGRYLDVGPSDNGFGLNVIPL